MAPSPTDNGEKKVELRRVLSLTNCIGILVGNMIGSGIFLSPTGVLLEVRSVGVSLIVWLASGIFSMMGAYSYVELAGMMPQSGGDFSYTLDVCGPMAAFLRIWCEIMVIRPGCMAIVALTCSEYLLQPEFSTCTAPSAAMRLLAAVAILIVSFVNCISVKAGIIVQDVCMYVKTATLIVVIGFGIAQAARGHTEQFENVFADTEITPGTLARAAYAGLFAYYGWNSLNCVTGEVRNPKRNVPLAILISVSLVTTVYVLTNAAYFTVVPVDQFLQTPAVAVLFAQRLFGSAAPLMSLCVAMSTLGGMNGILVSTSRVFHAAGEHGLMPACLSLIQQRLLTPAPAVIVTGGLSLCYLVSDDIYAMMRYVSLVTWLAVAFTVSLVLYLRFAQPGRERQLQVPLAFPAIFVALVLLLCSNSIAANPIESLYALGMILSGLPAYLLLIRYPHPKLTAANAALTQFVQKLLLALPADEPQ